LPLTMIFNRSLMEGRLPEDWKIATIIPIFKKGVRTDPGNYRPVSLTSVPYKLMERVLRSRILEAVERNNPLRKEQHGFRKGRSCLTDLLEVLEDWTQKSDG